MPKFSFSSTIRLRRRGPVLLGAGARLRPHVLADAHRPAGRAAAGRMAPAADQRRLLDPRRRHLPARQGRLQPHAGRQRPGYRDFRGSIETTGQFCAQRQMVWGWDGTCRPTASSSRTTACAPTSAPCDPLKSGGPKAVSQLYLTGRGDRSYFDMRAIYYYGFSASRRAEPDSDHPSGDRLQATCSASRCSAASSSYQGQLHQPDPRQRRLRSDHADRLHQRPVRRSADRRSGGQDSGQLPAARHPRHLYARSPPRRTGGARIIDPYGQMFTPFVIAARRRRGAVGQATSPASPTYLPPGDSTRRPRHADRRPGIPLSVHQRAVLGHADDRADRAGHRAAERDRRSASCRTRIRRA